jgi:hypothetical protein
VLTREQLFKADTWIDHIEELGGGRIKLETGSRMTQPYLWCEKVQHTFKIIKIHNRMKYQLLPECPACQPVLEISHVPALLIT